MNTYTAPSRLDAPAQGAAHERGAAKMLSRIRVRVDASASPPKPPWIRVRVNSDPDGLARARRIKRLLREANLHSVCEEARCPNLGECFGRGTATFLVMGDVCTRRCAFCDVAHGRPEPLDPLEPARLAATVRRMGLHYVVVTSVDRDDLPDGGAAHFSSCVRALRAANSGIRVEILVPDFRGRMEPALAALAEAPCDVFNHNVETVERLYPHVRPGADYAWSLALLDEHKRRLPDVPTKSGLMLGLGETLGEVERAMCDLRDHGVEMLTLGQYLKPGPGYLPVARYAHPDEFSRLATLGREMGFTHVAAGPMVRSSYHADLQVGSRFPGQRLA